MAILESKKIPLGKTSNASRLSEISNFLNTLPSDTITLLPTKAMCQALNAAMLDSINSEKIELIAEDNIECARHLKKKAETLLAKYEDDCSMTAGLDYKIEIKRNAKVMLRRNIDVTLGLVNGAIGVVKEVKWDLDNPKKVKSVLIKFSHGLEHALEPVKSKFQLFNKAFVYRT